MTLDLQGERKTNSVKTAALKSHDEYLAALRDDKRRALETLRKDIKTAAPEAEECISYGIPGFRLKGKGSQASCLTY